MVVVREAPGPGRGRQLAHLLAFRRDPTGFLLRLARRYGDVVEMRLGPRRIFLLSHPDAVRDVLVTRNRLFAKELGRRMLGNGLLTSEGEFHHHHRRLLQPVFHRERVAAYGEAVTTLALRARERWHDGQTLDMDREMTRLTLAVVGRTLFGVDVEAEEREFGEALHEAFQPAAKNLLKAALDWSLPGWSETRGGEDGENGAWGRPDGPTGRFGGRLAGALARGSSRILERTLFSRTRRFRTVRRRLDTRIYEMIAERRRRAEDHGDLLTVLLQAGRGHGAGMDDRQVRDEALTLFLAGHETVSNAVTWTLYLLSEHPEADAGLHQELESVLGDRSPSADDLARLPYLGRVLRESMRLYPPAWLLSRRVLADYHVEGYRLPRGSMALLSQWVVHHDPRWWVRPFRFDPDRWSDEAASERPKFAYFPFGAGPRLCIGEGFAWMECALILAAVAQRWRARLVPGHPVELLPTITLRPKGGMRMTLASRTPAN